MLFSLPTPHYVPFQAWEEQLFQTLFLALLWILCKYVVIFFHTTGNLYSQCVCFCLNTILVLRLIWF